MWSAARRALATIVRLGLTAAAVGMKEPSSEMIAAVAGALDTTLVDLAAGVVESLRTAQAMVCAGRLSRAAYALAA